MIAAALLLLVAQADADAVLARDCVAENDDADRAVAACWEDQAAVWEARVGVAYAAAAARVDPEMRRPVGEAQRAWQSYAAATCAQWRDVRGTVAVRLTALCRRDQAKLRVEELNGIDGLSG